MTRYVALLRGINLGPSKKISMPALRQMTERLGYDRVTSYINSGNLIFDSDRDPADLEQEICAAVSGEFGLAVDVCVRSADQLAKVLAANPYPDGDPAKVTVAFLTRPAPATAPERVAALASEHEPFTFAGSEVYVHYGQGQARSKLAQRFADTVGVSCTVRNLRTVAKLVELTSP
jgi:uncharacterized protein (DUF1697 family)